MESDDDAEGEADGEADCEAEGEDDSDGFDDDAAEDGLWPASDDSSDAAGVTSNGTQPTPDR